MSALLDTFELVGKLRETGTTFLYRGRDRRDNRSVLLKVPGRMVLPAANPFRVRREFDLLHSLAGVPGTIQPREIFEDPQGDILVLEPFEGQLLETAAKGRSLDIVSQVTLAESLGETLDRIHKKKIVYKALNPAGILFNPGTGEVRLSDFDLASELAREASDQFTPLFGGSPAYISPEQTGRANCRVDYRSDYYSLGMVMYWMATGTQAFGSGDLVEMIHCHLAKVPTAPHHFGVPRALSDIIVKLTAKSPEDRYQTMAGLLADLARFKAEWALGGRGEPFPLGTQDALGRLHIPQKPYGREPEVQKLRDAFDRASKGSREILFVTGAPGIGKTTVVRELYETLTASRGYLLRGKFDQNHRDVPYHAMVEAVEDGISQVLAGPQDQVSEFKTAVVGSLLTNTGVLGSLVPGFKNLVEGLAEPVPLSPKETESRLFLSFSALLRTFATADHPVLLFLDDVQWCDSASVKLLEHLCFAGEIAHLLVVLSYRDNEMLDTTPFRLFLDKDRQLGYSEGIHLEPLSPQALGQVVADTFRCSPDKALALTSLLHARTLGNPFFAGQFLAVCHSDGLISFDPRDRTWTWDLPGIEALGFSDDVLGLLAASIQKLPAEAVACLKFASCLGSQFTLGDLEPFTGEVDSLDEALMTLLEAEYLVPQDGDYVFLRYPGQARTGFNPGFRFQHDRIRQAAYDMVPENDRKKNHLRIARAGRDNLIDLAAHYNLARDLVTTPEEWGRLALLDFQAATQARASSMFDLAWQLLSVSREIIDAHPEIATLEFRKNVLFSFAEAAYTVQRFDEAEEACAKLDPLLPQGTDKARLLRLQGDFYNFLSMIPGSLAKSRDALAQVGITIPLEPTGEELYGQILAVGALMAAKTTEEIFALPDLTDEGMKLALGILAGFIVPAFMSGNQNLFALASLTAVKLALENGHCAESAIAFGNYGILLSGKGQYQAAFGVSDLAIRLNDRFQDQKWKAFIHSNHTLFTLPWTKPWAEFVDHSRKTIDFGFQTGDLFIMAYQWTYVVAWDETLTLAQAVESQERYLEIIRETGQEGAWACGKFASQLWKGLAGRLPVPGSFDEQGFSADEFVKTLADQKNYSALAIHHLYSMESLWYFGRYTEALAASRDTDTLAAALAGSAYMAEACLFTFLVYASNLEEALPQERPALLDRMEKERGRMAAWALSCPANFEALATFLDAETARRTGNAAEARDLYRKVFIQLQRSSNKAHRAIIHETAAGFYRALGDRKITEYLVLDAWQWYGQWGAAGKQRHLEALYPDLRFGSLQDPAKEIGIDVLVDSTSLVKATQAISKEIDRNSLFRKVIPIILENAGAQAVWLVLWSEGPQGTVAASGTTDGTSLQNTPVPKAVQDLMGSGSRGFLAEKAASDPRFSHDPEIKARNVRSALGVPLGSPGGTTGYWYLENNLLDGAFTPGKLETLRALSAQVAISLDNARMYGELEELNRNLEQRVVQRTEELAEKNRQIVSSIEYAAILQRSILPDPQSLARTLANHFILWKPRDLVGGDLYWFQETPFGFFLAVADCTGHGVPGAFMTMAAHSALDQCASGANPSDPAGFLSALHRVMKKSLGQNRAEPEADDGLDIGFCAYTAFDDTLHFAGGRIDLAVMGPEPGRPNLVRGDRSSLGYQAIADDQHFTNHKIRSASGLTFYLASDGISSQMGGDKSLPFGRERLLAALGSLDDGDFGARALKVETTLAAYQGEFEQIDDITLVGFQVAQVKRP